MLSDSESVESGLGCDSELEESWPLCDSELGKSWLLFDSELGKSGLHCNSELEESWLLCDSELGKSWLQFNSELGNAGLRSVTHSLASQGCSVTQSSVGPPVLCDTLVHGFRDHNSELFLVAQQLPARTVVADCNS